MSRQVGPPSWVRKKMRRHVRERDGGCCWVCGREIDPGLEQGVDPLSETIEHKLPVCHGGTWDLENLALSHLGCNRWRGDSRSRSPFRGAMT